MFIIAIMFILDVVKHRKKQQQSHWGSTKNIWENRGTCSKLAINWTYNYVTLFGCLYY